MLNKPVYRDPNMQRHMPVVSVRCIRLAGPKGGEDRQLRVSAPVTGDGLPCILFSHGYGSSMDGYGPLVDYWAAEGFVVVQPTYLDARRLGMAGDDPRRPDIWKTRVMDAIRVIDNLESIVAQVPGLAGRVDHSLLAAAGHSFGGQTTSMLLGARMMMPYERHDMSEPRIKAGLLLASGGTGALSDLGRQITPYLNTDFAHMITPALVIAGDQDHSPLTSRGPDWFYDPYYLSPGSKALLTLFGAEHMLGGISGYEVTETTDENPDRVALIQKVTSAYFKYRLLGEDRHWTAICARLAESADSLGKIEWKAN